MKNFELHNYSSKPISDIHIHLHVESTLDESLSVFNNVINHFNYQRIALQALPSYDVISNLKALYFKSKIDGAYANLGLLHNFDSTDTADNYLEQAKTCYAMGCDGFKMLEGKPDYRKQLAKSLCDKSLDKFYAFAEEKGLPIVMHFGDPREFWDIERIPKWALERGWLYDESFVHFDAAQKEVEGILEKFPKLHLILAHFFFVSDDIEYAENFMNKWENVCFDLTPGTEMYFNFNDKADEWKKFFIKYSDRIIYGTDIYNWHSEGLSVEEKYSHAVNLERSFLEKKEPFVDKWTNREFNSPFGFEADVLDNIYNNNFVRLFGNERRALDNELIISECKKAIDKYNLNELETENLKLILKSFSEV